MNPNQYSNPFMSSFFTKPLVGSIVHTHKFICGESEILDIVEGGNKESVIANMTLSEVLATWINHQLSTKLIEGINKFTKTYQFTQLLSKCQKLSELYTKDQKGFFLHFRKDYQFRKEMHTMNFTNGIVILALMLSLKPQKINYHSYLELHFDSPEARYAAIRQHLEKLKINFDLNDLMTNNTTSITQLFAHLFVIHHSLGSDKSESLFHSAIIKQIANSFMPFFGRAIGTKLFIITVFSILPYNNVEEFFVNLINEALQREWLHPMEKKEEDKSPKKLEKQLESYNIQQISRLQDLYENNYRSLLLVLTILAPEFLFDFFKYKEVSHELTRMNQSRAVLITDIQQKVNLSILKIMNSICNCCFGKLTFQDLESKRYNKITATLAEVLLQRPLCPYSGCPCLISLYCSYQKLKKVNKAGDILESGTRAQQFLEEYESRSVDLHKEFKELHSVQNWNKQFSHQVQVFRYYLLLEPPYKIEYPLSSQLQIINSIGSLEDEFVSEIFGIFDKQAIAELNEGIQSSIKKYMSSIINLLGIQSNSLDSIKGLILNYFDVVQFFKSLNFSTFRVDQGKLEVHLNKNTIDQYRVIYLSD